MEEASPAPSKSKSGGKHKKKAVKEELPDEDEEVATFGGRSADKPSSSGQLNARMELRRTRVHCTKDAPEHTSTMIYSGTYAVSGYDNSLKMEEWARKLQVQVKSLTEDDMVFDLIGVDPAIANALRRILIAEVPTMAIEKVFFANNTSLVQDEVLAHRLGMVPLRVDPRKFEFKMDDDPATETNTIVFKLDVKCTRKGQEIVNARVLSGALEYQPLGSSWPKEEEKKFTSFTSNQPSRVGSEGGDPRTTHDDIILAKLRPGQAIELEAHAVKGQGKTHAKWSPVATATYRMLPEVVLLQKVQGERADELVAKCPKNVFDIEDLGSGLRGAKVSRPRDCTLCRECVREGDWDSYVELRRVKEHFIFSIESTGGLPPDVLFQEALLILADKCERILSDLT